MYDEWGHLPYNPWEFKIIRDTTVLKKIQSRRDAGLKLVFRD